MIREKYYCGLDLGAQKIKAGILKVKDAAQMELVGIYEQKTAGFCDGAVSDLGELSDCVHATVHTLLQKPTSSLKKCSWAWVRD